MAVDGMALVGEGGPEIVMFIGGCMPIQPGNMQNIGDIFIDDASGTLGVWNGTNWAMIDSQGDPFLIDSSMSCLQSLTNYSCPYCGTLNLLGAAECGAGCWNGCGAPLGVQ